MSKQKNATWEEAKKRCRLNQADIQMAKELGMTPKSLLKNIPSHKQQWKVPVKVWIRDLYEKKFGYTIKITSQLPEMRKIEWEKRKSAPKIIDISDEELPF
ncbi:hypothetical protein BKP37_06590 [Anaerobacillus alkalilacustris]|uniref:Uncharacterized protein n=1 Tax=Anaerobacillus alkalilacustris TaxID=393763 RepID=A0A1S2LS41_9BACI|nr:hypothetical protein [Anaerobacillus alkalilacustris]OIJ15331.1 hypothetical protein BKP37_06590 [Anaerobacillus alkalilacustris]